MASRPLLSSLSLIVATWALSCGPGEDQRIAATTRAPVSISGRYDVKGLTSTPGNPNKRSIEGIVTLAQKGDTYAATYALKTTWRSEGEIYDPTRTRMRGYRVDTGTPSAGGSRQ